MRPLSGSVVGLDLLLLRPQGPPVQGAPGAPGKKQGGPGRPPPRSVALADQGVLLQVDANSFLSGSRRSPRAHLACRLVETGHAPVLASDTYRAQDWPPVTRLAEARETVAQLVGHRRAEWLTEGVRKAIIEGKLLRPSRRRLRVASSDGRAGEAEARFVNLFERRRAEIGVCDGRRYPQLPVGVLLYAMGARPNFVKMAPVIAALRKQLPEYRHVLVHTGQHYDRMMSDVFLEELGVPEPDHVLGVGSASHAVQTARVMERIEPILEAERPQLVVVPGDVNSTLAVSLVAVKLGIPLAHLEAGLRSFDRTMPEEINRIVADEFSEYLFIHSDEARDNLKAEGIPSDRIHLVGNTMIDSLVAMEPRVRAIEATAKFGVRPRDYLLVTLHRPALVDGPLLREVLAQLSDIARELPVVFPAHPRTRKMMQGMAIARGVSVIDPVGYLDFLSLESDATAVLTDSGGVQEETTYLRVPCFTLRDNTERPVTIRAGTNTLLGLDPSRIADILPALGGNEKSYPPPPPGWDGQAAQRVASVICGKDIALMRTRNVVAAAVEIAEAEPA